MGYALIETVGNSIKYRGSGILNNSKVDDFLLRPRILARQCGELALEASPDIIAIESLIYVKNVDSMLKLAQARGAILAGLNFENEIPIFEYAPNLVKSSVTGFGHASKGSVSKALEFMFPQVKIKSTDESDALAIAVCHALLSKTRVNYPSSKSSQSTRSQSNYDRFFKRKSTL
jgi:crossover junction endodeoxyribonuclease RuvC